MGTHNICFCGAEAVLMSTHNKCFCGEISRIMPLLSPNTHLICSTEYTYFIWLHYFSLSDLKKDIQELYGLISFGVLRKKMRGGV